MSGVYDYSELDEVEDSILQAQKQGKCIIERELKRKALELCKQTPSWKRLIRNYKSYSKYIAGGNFEEKSFTNWINSPSNLNFLLTCEASVMDVRSSRCNILRECTDAVIAEAGLERRPEGEIRGQDSPDYTKFAAKLGYTKVEYVKSLGYNVYHKE